MFDIKQTSKTKREGGENEKRDRKAARNCAKWLRVKRQYFLFNHSAHVRSQTSLFREGKKAQEEPRKTLEAPKMQEKRGENQVGSRLEKIDLWPRDTTPVWSLAKSPLLSFPSDFYVTFHACMVGSSNNVRSACYVGEKGRRLLYV